MNASTFSRVFGENSDYWSQAEDYPLSDWQHEVSEDATRLGYWDWVLVQRENAKN